MTKDWSDKAEAEWNDVTPARGGSTPNLGKIVANVKAAVDGQKATRNMTKKQRKVFMAARALQLKREREQDALNKAAEQAIKEADQSNLDEQVDAVKVRVAVGAAVVDLRNSIRLAGTDLNLVNESTRANLLDKHRKILSMIKSAPPAVNRKELLDFLHTLDEEMGLLMDAIDKNVRDQNDPGKKTFVDRATAFFGKAKPTKDFVGPAAPGLITRGVQRGREFLKADSYSKGRMLGAGLRSGSSKIADGLLGAVSNSGPMVAKSIKALTNATKSTGRSIKDATTDTFKWLGKKMSGMAGMLSRFLRAPFGGSDNALQSLIGMGLVFSTMIKPILEGIDAELKSRFGDKYIEDFIGGLWSKTWSYLVGKIREFLGIKTQAAKDAETKERVKGIQSNADAAKAAYAQAPTAENKKKLDEANATLAQVKVDTLPKNTDPVTKLRAMFDAYKAKAAKGPVGAMDKFRIQSYIENANVKVPEPLATELRREGIYIRDKNVAASAAVTPSSNSGPVQLRKMEAGASAPLLGGSPGSSPTGVSSPVSASGSSGGGTVGVSSPTRGPMEGSKGSPVTAKPNSLAPETQPSTGSQTGSTRSMSAAGATQIPTYASSEGFHVFNLGVC